MNGLEQVITMNRTKTNLISRAALLLLMLWAPSAAAWQVGTAELEKLLGEADYQKVLEVSGKLLSIPALAVEDRARIRLCQARAFLGLKQREEAVKTLLEIAADPRNPRELTRMAEAELAGLPGNVMFEYPAPAAPAKDSRWVMFFPKDRNYAGDPIPFVDGNVLHLFYLFAPGGTAGWNLYHLETSDFLSYEDRGIAIARSTEPGSIDRSIATGCVIKHNGTYHFFYCSMNGEARKQGKPVQVIRKSTSPDLKTWTRKQDFLLIPDPSKGYHPTESWRDPFVFWNKERNEFWMLVTADSGDDSKHRWNRGVIGLATSKDLEKWEIQKPLLEPGRYMNYECPNLLKWGDWYYLIYSPDMSPNLKMTRYMMSRSPSGPWVSPADDVFDGRAYYAAQTFSRNGNEHYIVGWISRRNGHSDTGAWRWGGNLAVHRLTQRGDGSLGARMADTVRGAFQMALALQPRIIAGEWRIENAANFTSQSALRTPNTVDAPLRYPGRSLLHLGTLPDRALVEFTIRMSSASGSAGLILGAAGDLSGGHEVRLEAFRGRLRFTAEPDRYTINQQLERPLVLAPGQEVSVRVLVDGTCVTIYAGGDVALSGRMYERRANAFGLFVEDTGASFSHVALITPR